MCLTLQVSFTLNYLWRIKNQRYCIIIAQINLQDLKEAYIPLKIAHSSNYSVLLYIGLINLNATYCLTGPAIALF